MGTPTQRVMPRCAQPQIIHLLTRFTCASSADTAPWQGASSMWLFVHKCILHQPSEWVGRSLVGIAITAESHTVHTK